MHASIGERSVAGTASGSGLTQLDPETSQTEGPSREGSPSESETHSVRGT